MEAQQASMKAQEEERGQLQHTMMRMMYYFSSSLGFDSFVLQPRHL